MRDGRATEEMWRYERAREEIVTTCGLRDDTTGRDTIHRMRGYTRRTEK